MTFREELEQLINKYSVENGSDTPDFILAAYLTNVLDAYGSAVKLRDNWYGFTPFADSPAAKGDSNVTAK